MRFVFPPPLRPGDLVSVVAPSSPFEAGVFWRGLAWVRDRYRVRISPGVLARDAFLAGPDARRQAELARAMEDPEVKAILAARGGYGAMRIVDTLPWDAFRASPKWICGFSDVTALHVMAWGAGVASVHGPNVTGVGDAADARMRASWLAALERPHAARTWSGLRIVHAGPDAKGPLVGGNLALVAAMAGAGKLRVPDGAVLVLEDVTERPYRVDRMLTTLRLGGHLDRLSGLVLGDFVQCDPGRDGRTVDEVLADVTRPLGVHVVAGAPFGHGVRNDAFVIGAEAALRGDTLVTSIPSSR